MDVFMDQYFKFVGTMLLVLMLPVLYRVVTGPTVVDRMIGVNIIGAKTMVLLIVIGSIYQRVDMFVDLALTYALLNFLASLAFARFLHRRKTAVPQPRGHVPEWKVKS